MASNKHSAQDDLCGRRAGQDRREAELPISHPDRRSGRDRRSGIDRRSEARASH